MSYSLAKAIAHASVNQRGANDEAIRQLQLSTLRNMCKSVWADFQCGCLDEGETQSSPKGRTMWLTCGLEAAIEVELEEKTRRTKCEKIRCGAVSPVYMNQRTKSNNFRHRQ